jgi:hypothetical protein
MSSGAKGAWLGAATIVTISILWAAVAGTRDDLNCVHYEHMPAGDIIVCGVLFGIPVAVIVGCFVGMAAADLRSYRRVFLLIVAASLACVLAVLGRAAMQCTTDPATSSLWLRAFLALALACLVLERWTRPDEPMPRATARAASPRSGPGSRSP